MIILTTMATLSKVGTCWDIQEIGIISGHGQGDFMKGGCNQATLSNTAKKQQTYWTPGSLAHGCIVALSIFTQ